MSTLIEHRPNTYSPTITGEVGIEIETETSKNYNVPTFRYWLAQSDGSLRNFGVEFVLSRPLNVNSKEYLAALKEFEEFAKNQVFLESVYTSVHVHLNFLHKDVKHLTNFIVLYVILENVLTRYCGPDRDGNLFCLKTENAEASIAVYRDLIERLSRGDINTSRKFLGSLNANTNKYSGLNVVPLRNLGSVEVRTHPGTTDVIVIDRWVQILYRLYTRAVSFADPPSILQMVHSSKSYKEFVKDIFGAYYVYFSEENIDNDIHATLFFAKTLVYDVADWKEYGIIKTPKQFVEVKTDPKLFLDSGYISIFEDIPLVTDSFVTTYEPIGDM